MPAKKDDATAAEKAIGLYVLLLLSNRAWSLSQLAEHFKCAKSTILRLANTIARYEGTSLRTEERTSEGRLQHWFSLERSRRERARRNMLLSADELRLLHLCRDIAAPFLSADLCNALGDTLRRASVLLPATETPPETPQSLVQPAFLGIIDYAPLQHILNALLRAIEDRTVCEITYALPGKEARTYEMAVTRLVSGNRALYAHGWKVADKGRPDALHPLFFAVHRIRAVLPTRRTHELSTPEEAHGFGIMAGDPFRVRVHIAREAADYVRDRVFGPEQALEDADDGSVVLSFIARSEAELLGWVLSFGRRARVLEPEGFAKTVRKEVRAMLRVRPS